MAGNIFAEQINSLTSMYGSEVKVKHSEDCVTIDIANGSIEMNLDIEEKRVSVLSVGGTSLGSDAVLSLTEVVTDFLDHMSSQHFLSELLALVYKWILDHSISLACEPRGEVAGGRSKSEVCKFYLEGKCRFGDDCRNIHGGRPGKGKGKKQEVKKVNEPDRVATEKKPAMKTASDVVSRILWDDKLPMERFVIGYLDRFEGVIEKGFGAFSWEDIASVDYDTLAIPKHRIQYFKYRGAKVWDKSERLDVVFGSVGENEMSILEFMAHRDQVLEELGEEVDTVNAPVAADAVCADVSGESKERCDDRIKPTHFLAFRVDNTTIQERAREVLDDIRARDERLSEAVTPVPRLHLTVCMLHLPATHLVTDTVAALQDLHFHVPAPTNLHLELDGISHFGSRVIFLQVRENPELSSYVMKVHSYLHRLNINVIHDFSFHPHVTITKMSRVTSAAMRTRLVEPGVYTQHQHKHFGEQMLSQLHLCPIGESPDRSQFYRTITCVPIHCERQT